MTFISIKRNGAKTELEEDCAVQHCPHYTISKVNCQNNIILTIYFTNCVVRAMLYSTVFF